MLEYVIDKNIYNEWMNCLITLKSDKFTLFAHNCWTIKYNIGIKISALYW